MRKASPWIAVMLAGTLFTGGIIVGTARADIFGSVLKGGLIAVVIKQFNRPINDALNKLTGSAGAPVNEATKVVPIITAGQGSYVGAAQVSGPGVQVDQVQAVGMLEGSINGKQIQLKALVPIDTNKPGKTLTRVKGVGVSAIIDIHV